MIIVQECASYLHGNNSGEKRAKKAKKKKKRKKLINCYSTHLIASNNENETVKKGNQTFSLFSEFSINYA